MTEYQTRSEENGVKIWDNLPDAFAEAERDNTVWKISWTTPEGDRIRMIREDDNSLYWSYSPIEVGL